MFRSRVSRLGWAFAWGLLVTGYAGCGSADPDAIPAVPAAGTVTYQGKPLENGDIQFVPERGRPAHGTITDGKFTLTTYAEDDGAIPGKHMVGVSAWKEKHLPGGDTDTQMITPEKYGTPESSGIVVEVPPDGKEDFVIEIQ